MKLEHDAMMLVGLMMFMAGCTSVHTSGDVTILPATSVNILGAQDAQYSDRMQRAGEDAGETMGNIEADQESKSTPTLTIPMTGGPPLSLP